MLSSEQNGKKDVHAAAAAALKQLCNICASSWCAQYIPHHNGCAQCNKIGGYLWKYADKKMKIQKYGILKVLLVYPLTRTHSTSHQAREQLTHNMLEVRGLTRFLAHSTLLPWNYLRTIFFLILKLFLILFASVESLFFCCSFSFLFSVWRFEHVSKWFFYMVSGMQRIWMVLQKLINHAIAIFT